ncbi:MAG: enoyl-CoA hydratase/isomerase family protein [Gammaproteobacteria bacterium]
MNKHDISEVLFDEIPGFEGNLGIITLNRPKALNALNHAMFIAMDKQLRAWETQANIKAVIIRAAEGRAFCAGGDIRHAYELKQANDPSLAHFFRDEYRLNLRIYHYPKPYIALLDGITMGGGAGVSIHGSQRVATDRLIFAMPETGIGFYPDVGATHFLAQLPYKMGFYLGLTGAKITYADCLALGLVQEVVAQEAIAKIIPALAEHALPDKKAATEVLKRFAINPPKSDLLQYKKEIETYFAKNTVEEILTALENDSSEWCQQTAAVIKTKSPTSLKVTLHALQESLHLNFDRAMQMEYGLTTHFIQGHDFFEGIRAVVIDKDQKPKWRPARLADVSSEDVEKYFMPLTEELV